MFWDVAVFGGLLLCVPLVFWEERKARKRLKDFLNK